MVLFLFLSLILAFLLAGPKLHLTIQADEPWLSRERTSFVNGFFIILVFISHIRQYQLDVTPFETRLIQELIPNQLIVTTFFFFSGYGLMHSIKAKGRSYVRAVILRRFPQLLLNFSVAVLLFAALQAALGHTCSLCHILLSLPGWESVGNSNWFICMTLLAYLFIFLSFSLLGVQRPYAAVTLVAVLLALCAPLILLEKDTYWVDTYLCIPAGMLFSLLKGRMESFFAKTHVPAIAVGLGLLIIGYCLHINTAQVYWHLGLPAGAPRLPAMMAGSVVFALGLTITYGCVTFRMLPRVMVWMGGAALFPMYIFQRIPMILGHHFEFNQTHTDLYVAGCLVAGMLLAVCFERIYAWMGHYTLHSEVESAGKP